MTKRFLRRLEEYQRFDVALPPPVVVELKFILRASRHCRQVLLRDEGVFDPQVALDPRSIPSFLLSQFEAQKLVERPATEIMLTPILWFLQQYAVPPGCQRKKPHPTLFTWHSSRVHRTYVIFAHLEIKMESRRYNIEELLGWKTGGASEPLRQKFEQDTELGMLIHSKHDPRRVPKEHRLRPTSH